MPSADSYTISWLSRINKVQWYIQQNTPQENYDM